MLGEMDAVGMELKDLQEREHQVNEKLTHLLGDIKMLKDDSMQKV